MKTLIALTAVGLVSFGFANSAAAYKLSPPNTAFSATGSATLMKSGVTVTCTSTYRGKTTATGIAHVTSAIFSGANPACAGISALHLPWTVKATSATQGKFTNVEVTSALGTCGPGTVLATDNSTGLVSYNTTLNPGACGINGSVQTTPAIVIVP